MTGESDIRDGFVTDIWNELASKHPPVGSAGYEVPDIEGHTWVRVSPENSFANMTFHAGGSNLFENWMVIPETLKCLNPINVFLSRNSHRNVIVIGLDSAIYGNYHLLGTDGLVVLHGGQRQASQINVGIHSNRGFLFWGKGGTSNGTNVTIQGQGGSVIVGEDAMFAERVTIRNSDMHPVISMSDGAWINRPKNVLIEPHVWACQESMVQKGVTVGFGSVLAARSIVTKGVPRFCIVSGAPATVTKRGVSWDRPESPKPTTHYELASFEAQLTGE